jgi:hypothetical protein
MADQTIEIKLVLRDELTRQLQPIIANLKQLNSAVDGAKFQQASQQAQHFGRSIQVVRRELSTLGRLTFGGIIGGGIVAGLVATGKALGDMANRSLQLRYIADSLNTQTSVLNDFSDAFMGIGKTQEEGASAIQAAGKALRELQIEGRESSLFKELERTGGASGRRIAAEMAKEMAGPRGLQGGIELALRRMANMGQADAAKFGQVMGFGPGFGRQAARDYLEVLGQLPKRLELPRQQALDLAKANAAWAISWDNIKTTLGAAFIPTLAKITQSLDEFLQSPSGQNFAMQLEFWGWLLAKAVDEWLKNGGLQRAAAGLTETVGYLKAGFTEADKVIQAMGLSWPAVIASLVGLRLLAPILRSVGASLGVIAAIPGVATILAALAIPGLLTALIVNKDAIRDALQKQKEEQDKAGPGAGVAEETRKQGYIPQLLDVFWQLLRGNVDLWGKGAPKSGDETPKSELEKRGDLDEKKRSNRELTREFAALEYEMTKLNAYIQPGGPEGGGGTSGFQFSDMQFNDPTPSQSPYSQLRTSNSFKQWLERQTPSTNFEDRSKEWAPGLSDLQKDYFSRKASMAMAGREFPYEIVPSTGYPYIETKYDRAEQLRWKNYDKIPSSHGVDWQQSFANNPTFRAKEAEQNALRESGSLKWFGFNPLNPRAPRRTSPEGPAGLSSDFGSDTIINYLAGRERSLGGSATVDIDVSSLGQSARNPADLFKPVPLGGIEQMQNITRPENNPLSQQ